MKYSDLDYQHLQEVVTLYILLYKFMSCYSQLQKKRWTNYRYRTKSHGCRCHPGLEHTYINKKISIQHNSCSWKLIYEVLALKLCH